MNQIRQVNYVITYNLLYIRLRHQTKGLTPIRLQHLTQSKNVYRPFAFLASSIVAGRTQNFTNGAQISDTSRAFFRVDSTLMAICNIRNYQI